MTKKIYLSGPMSICKDKETWFNNFNKYEEIFKKKGYEVVNPAKNEILDSYSDCLKNSLIQEMGCDCIFFMENSILSVGARLEYDIAKALGLEIVTLSDDISFEDNYATKSGLHPYTKNEKVNVQSESNNLNDVMYIQLEVAPRYFEDSYIDDESDISIFDMDGKLRMPHMPCVKSYAKSNQTLYEWEPLIDIHNGKILNWTKGVTAKTNYKVCDEGVYYLLDKDFKVINKVESYVPNIFGIDAKGWGDYIHMTIDADGNIKNWKCTVDDLKEIIESQLPTG